MSNFSHLDKSGNPKMVDVSGKAVTQRVATARSIVVLPEEVIKSLTQNEMQTPKGAVFQTAILAGTIAVKKTSDMIPLCHPLPITKCAIDINLNEREEIVIECTVKVDGKTGVEMEALTGCSVAALTIYDMCKAFSQEIVIKETKLIHKSGGKTDYHAE